MNDLIFWIRSVLCWHRKKDMNYYSTMIVNSYEDHREFGYAYYKTCLNCGKFWSVSRKEYRQAERERIGE